MADRRRLPYTGLVGACRKCGEANPPHAVFCLACGVRLRFGDLRPDSRKPVTILFNDVVESTALMDLIVAVSACPMDLNPISGHRVHDLEIEVE